MDGLTKRKYKQKEVAKLLEELAMENNVKLKEKDSKIALLNEQLNSLTAKVKQYSAKEEEIATTVITAQNTASKITQKAEQLYNLEIEKLKLFSVKWQKYFSYIFQTYPNYEIIKKTKELSERCEKVFSTKSTSKEKILSVEKLINDNAPFQQTTFQETTFNPQEKIHQYIKNNTENSFNLDEVLNPTEKLNLEDLCKELGLMDTKQS